MLPVSKVNKINSITHFSFLIIVLVEIQPILLCLSVAHFIHHTSTFPLFSPLPSICLWGSEGREHGFFFLILQMRKLKVNLKLNLSSILKSPRKFKNIVMIMLHPNFRIWDTSINIFHTARDSKAQLSSRTTGLDDLYLTFRCNCLLPECSLSTNERDSFSLNIEQFNILCTTTIGLQ